MLGVSLMPTTMPSSTKLAETNSDVFANALTNLKLNTNIIANNTTLNGHAVTLNGTNNNNYTNNSTVSNGLVEVETIENNSNNNSNKAHSLPKSANINQYKSEFKTIKIFIASNKDGKLYFLFEKFYFKLDKFYILN